MISAENLEKLARQYRMSLFPAVTREYFQHVFLEQLYRMPKAESLLFKGGTALRIVYGSPRFSEDLDFSLYGFEQYDINNFVEDIFIKVLEEITRSGIRTEIGQNTNPTTGGYFATAIFRIFDFDPVSVELNISSHASREKVRGEVDSVTGDFVPTYSVVHLPQVKIVEEKVFGALRERKKPRDYYDLYFMLRRNMLSAEQKSRLAEVKEEIIKEASHIDFSNELGAFLPADQRNLARDFGKTLGAEMRRQL